MKRGRRFRISIIPVFLILPLVCFAQARRSTQRPNAERTRPPFLQAAKSLESTPSLTKLVLRNGLTILVEEFRSQPLVSIQAHIQGGTFNEPANSIGVSRLLSAMIERTAADTNRGMLLQNVDSIGGIFNRSVDYTESGFEIVAPSAQWKQALQLLGDAVTKAPLDNRDLTSEADLVLGEARAALEDPNEFAREMILELAFDQSRMGKYDEIVRGRVREINQQNLIDFYKATYIAPRITLVVSGDISSSEVFNEIVRIYGKMPPAAIKAASMPVRETQKGFRYRLLRGNVEAPHILFGFHAVPESAEDFRALEVLSAILGLGEGSILNVRLKNQMGLILNEQTRLQADTGFGYFLVYMAAVPENIDRCEIAALTEMELLKRKEIDEADLVRAKAQLELEYWKHRETATERAETIAYYNALGNWRRASNYVSEINKIEPSDIKRVANKYLRMDRCSLLEYLPAPAPVRNTTVEGMRQTLEGLLESSADEEEAKREKEVVPFMKIPESGDRFNFSEVRYPFRVASILRGPDMVIREDHTSPLIEMGLFFRGGKSQETSANEGITNMIAHLMLAGTKDLPGAQFHRQLEMYGARVQPVIEDDYFGFFFSVLSRNFAQSFDLLQQAIRMPDFEKRDIDRQKEMQRWHILERKNSEAFGEDVVNKGLFKDSAYSKNNLGSDSSLDEINDTTLLNWHGEFVQNRKPYVVMIGDTSGTSLADHFVKHFSGSRIQETKIPEEWTKSLDKPESFDEQWKRLESLFLIGFQAPPAGDEDGCAVRVIEKLVENQVLGPKTDSDGLRAANRMFTKYNSRLRGGSFLVGAYANPKNEDEILKAMKEQILSLAKGPNSYREVRSAVNSAVGAYQIRMQKRAGQIQEVTLNLLAGRGLDGYLNFPAELQTVKSEELAELMPQILDTQKSVVVRVHGQSSPKSEQSSADPSGGDK